jgi:hypothetical protein
MSSIIKYPPALHLVIRGKFWDSQIYSGTLYLFGRSGELVRMSWTDLVGSLPVSEDLRVAADTALLSNRTLYEPGARRLLADPDVRSVVVGKFGRLAAELADWHTTVNGTSRIRDNPFPFPHNDSEIYRSQLYVGGSEGLHCLAGGSERAQAVRYSDVPAMGIAAGYHTMAQASGSQGLVEVPLSFDSLAPQRLRFLSTLPCVSCEFAYLSVIASASDGALYMASFQNVPEENSSTKRRSFVRRLDRIIPETELFKDERYSGASFRWGARDKLFRYTAGRIEVLKYTPQSDPEQEKGPRGRKRRAPPGPPQFDFLSDIDLDDPEDASSVVSARAAHFGSVIEHDDGLFVVPSAGEPFFLKGEPTNWRVFPRSHDYRNHLHVIYEDRVEIVVFTHDYFIDQQTKLAGIEVPSSDYDPF